MIEVAGFRIISHTNTQQSNSHENLDYSDNKLSEGGIKIGVRGKKKKSISHRGRKHHRQFYSKQYEASNCGTKEPKGPSETHIEWQPEGKVCDSFEFPRKEKNHSHDNWLMLNLGAGTE